MLAHFNYRLKDKTRFALGWLPCLLMLITSGAQHFRGHLERSRDLTSCSLLLLLGWQPAFGSPFAKAQMTARHALRQDGLVLFLSPGRLLHAHLLSCACVKVGLRTCRAAALTALLHTFIGCRTEGHLVVCVHLSHPLESFVVFCFFFFNTPGCFSVSAN